MTVGYNNLKVELTICQNVTDCPNSCIRKRSVMLSVSLLTTA